MIKTAPTIHHAGLTDVGRVRSKNEDRWTVDSVGLIFLVSDGMGGRLAGDVASQAVAEFLPVELNQVLPLEADLTDPATHSLVCDAVNRISRSIREESCDQPGLCGMGATLAALIVRNRAALMIHVGDSRGYLLRNDRLHRLTEDHTLVRVLLDDGLVTEQDAETHPARSQLTQFMGMDGDVKPGAACLALQPADRLLLCTDGVGGFVDETTISRCLAIGEDPKDACRRVLHEASQTGGHDNATAVVLFVDRE